MQFGNWALVRSNNLPSPTRLLPKVLACHVPCESFGNNPRVVTALRKELYYVMNTVQYGNRAGTQHPTFLLCGSRRHLVSSLRRQLRAHPHFWP